MKTSTLTDGYIRNLSFYGFIEDESDQSFWEVIDKFRNKHQDSVVYYGNDRVVFILPTYVIKVPLNDSGIRVNVFEYSFQGNNTMYARTRQMWYRDIIPVNFQEYVTPLSFEQVEKYGLSTGVDISWVDSVDCWQVGLNKSNKLVSYDAFH